MTEHHLTEITKEEGSKESRYHAVCSCGWMSGDYPVRSESEREIADEFCRRDHKIHAEGGEAEPNEQHERMRVWAERHERDTR